jgi:hypothetical protein
VPFTPPIFKDHDPLYPLEAARIQPLGLQYEAVVADILDPATPVGAKVAQAVAAGGGGGLGYVDNGDGTLTFTSTGSYVDNGDGTLTIGA